MIQRNYRFTDADLCMIVSNLIYFIEIDMSDFETFGINEEKINELKELKSIFEIYPSDNSYVAEIMIATEDKNAVREQVLNIISQMAMRVSAKWGNDSSKYKRLNLYNPRKMSDNVLLTTSRSIHTAMVDYLPELEEYGLTADKLLEFENLNSTFENVKNLQQEVIANRDQTTIERIKRGNELYALVVKYSRIGKILYERTNPVKAKNYLIYKYD